VLAFGANAGAAARLRELQQELGRAEVRKRVCMTCTVRSEEDSGKSTNWCDLNGYAAISAYLRGEEKAKLRWCDYAATAATCWDGGGGRV
jgi:hypothetical protein